MRRLAPAAVLPLALLLSGCFQVFSTLTVRPDGSAQLVERITTEGTMAMMLMAGDDLMTAFDMDGDSTMAEEDEVSDEEALRSRFAGRAASFGAGVTVASVVEELAPGELTYVVTYDVPDVNALVYSFSDAADPESFFSGGSSGEMDGEVEAIEAVPADGGVDTTGDSEFFDEPGDSEVEEADDDAPFRFAFTPATGGAPATLRVTVPDQPLDMEDMDLEKLTSSDDPQQELKTAYVLVGRMEMRFDVAVEGELVSADRGWTEGNRVTLSALQMGEVLDVLRRQEDLGDMGALFAGQDPAEGVDLPGLRFAGAGPLDIRFQ